MCWNTTVSLNTFLFSGFILLLVMYNNTYTGYKIKELNNIWMYLFLASIIVMQLIEYFIWKNINNIYYNKLFSTLGSCILFTQPIYSLMLISNIQIRNIMLSLYLLWGIPYSIYQLLYKNIHSEIGKNGHLIWRYFELEPPLLFIWVFFLVFGLLYQKLWFIAGVGIILFIISYYKYKNENSLGSMWCWLVNTIMVYYAIYLLYYLPFYHKKDIC
jgi:hypothetical protein